MTEFTMIEPDAHLNNPNAKIGDRTVDSKTLNTWHFTKNGWEMLPIWKPEIAMTERQYINLSCKVKLDDALTILTHNLVWENLPDGIDVAKFQNAVRDLDDVLHQIQKLIEVQS